MLPGKHCAKFRKVIELVLVVSCFSRAARTVNRASAATLRLKQSFLADEIITRVDFSSVTIVSTFQ